jgi:hypothetical protein
MKRLLILILLASFQSLANKSPTTLICDYRKAATPDGLEAIGKNEFKLNFIIDSTTGKAYVLGNNGSEEVTMLSSGKGISFIEITDVGNVMVTTVDASGISVHSRNSIILGELVPSQYYGSCDLK